MYAIARLIWARTDVFDGRPHDLDHQVAQDRCVVRKDGSCLGKLGGEWKLGAKTATYCLKGCDTLGENTTRLEMLLCGGACIVHVKCSGNYSSLPSVGLQLQCKKRYKQTQAQKSSGEWLTGRHASCRHCC